MRWTISLVGCLLAWRHTGMSGWAFAAGLNAGFLFDSWAMRDLDSKLADLEASTKRPEDKVAAYEPVDEETL